MKINHLHPAHFILAVQVMWAEGEGREAIKALYMRSAGLNGDAVVVFVRALCAVSQVSWIARPQESLQTRCRYLKQVPGLQWPVQACEGIAGSRACRAE